MDVSGLSGSRFDAASQDDSGTSELDLRLRQVGEVLDAAQALFGRDGAVGPEPDHLRDIDAYLASKGIHPSPMARYAPSEPSSAGTVPSRFAQTLSSMPSARLDASRLPPDRPLPPSGGPSTYPPQQLPGRPVPPPVPVFSTTAPDLRSADDSLESALPFRFSGFMDDTVHTMRKSGGGPVASSDRGTAVGRIGDSGKEDASDLRPQSAPPVPEATHKYHDLTVNGAAWRELSSRVRELGGPPIVVNGVDGGTGGLVHEREVLEAAHWLLWLLSTRGRDAPEAPRASPDRPTGPSAARMQAMMDGERRARRDAEDKAAAAARELDARVKEFTRVVADSKARVAHSEHRARRREAELEEVRRKLAHLTDTHRHGHTGIPCYTCIGCGECVPWAAVGVVSVRV